jgi:hypothetical protein
MSGFTAVTALVAVVVEEVGGDVVVPVAAAAHVIAAGRLDLDHLGALVGQQHGAPGARHHGGEVEDAIAVERAGHGGTPGWLRSVAVVAAPAAWWRQARGM